MQSQNIKLGISSYFGIIFLVLLFGMIYSKDLIFSYILEATGESQIQESQKATQETATVLLSLDKITFDTSVLNSNYLSSLTPFVNFPIDAAALENFGKANPFLGNFIVVPTKATTSVGAVVYSANRPGNNGNSVRAVTPTTNRR